MKHLDSKKFQFRTPFKEDFELIRQLLSECNLPFSDIDPSKQYFIIAENDGKMIGCCGVEIYGDNVLFRSLAVSPDYRSLGIGRMLTDKIIKTAPEKGIQKLYLLTTTAGDFFKKQGWNETDRKNVPLEIGNTNEFMTLCPSMATCMMYSL